MQSPGLSAGMMRGASATDAESAAPDMRFVQCALSLQAHNKRLQKKIRLLEGSLHQALIDVEALKVQSGMAPPTPQMQAPPTPEFRHLTEPTPSTSAPSSPRLLGFSFDEMPLLLPPGLMLRPPPGLPPPGGAESQLAACMLGTQHTPQAALMRKDSGGSQLDMALPPRKDSGGSQLDDLVLGRSISASTVCSVSAMEWHIDNVHAKLRTSCGFPLISHTFNADDVADLRFLFVPGDKWAGTQRRHRNKHAKKPAAGVSQGPPNGALKLKVGSPDQVGTLRFNFWVGAVMQGPVTCDFKDQGVQGVDLEFDWLEQVDSAGHLDLRFEFF